MRASACTYAISFEINTIPFEINAVPFYIHAIPFEIIAVLFEDVQNQSWNKVKTNKETIDFVLQEFPEFKTLYPTCIE